MNDFEIKKRITNVLQQVVKDEQRLGSLMIDPNSVYTNEIFDIITEKPAGIYTQNVRDIQEKLRDLRNDVISILNWYGIKDPRNYIVREYDDIPKMEEEKRTMEVVIKTLREKWEHNVTANLPLIYKIIEMEFETKDGSIVIEVMGFNIETKWKVKGK